jgi:hypothetical protein
MMTRCVEHHFDDTFDIAVGLLYRTYVDAETARNGGADLFRIQSLTFDLAAFQNIFRQDL